MVADMKNYEEEKMKASKEAADKFSIGDDEMEAWRLGADWGRSITLKELEGIKQTIKNCKVGDFVILHPVKEPTANLLFEAISKLPSAEDVKKLVETLEGISVLNDIGPYEAIKAPNIAKDAVLNFLSKYPEAMK